MSSANRLGFWSAVITAAGVLLSGPIAITLVNVIAPQPRWHDVDTFVAHFHPIQSLPYFFGILLVGGSATMVLCLAEQQLPRGPRRTLATIVIATFVTLISLNYIIQTTFVPALCRLSATTAAPEREIIAALTLANPRSLGWALEMWGYGFLGLATWMVATNRRAAAPQQRWTSRLLIANGVVSIAGGFLTAWRIDWVFSSAGYVSFAAWNLLMLLVAIACAKGFRRRGFPQEKGKRRFRSSAAQRQAESGGAEIAVRRSGFMQGEARG